MKMDYMKPLYQKVKIVDMTHRVLSNGRRIPTVLNMERQAKKIAYAD